MSPITHLTNPSSHATFTSTISLTGTPSVLYVCNPSLPACKKFTPQYESLAVSYHSKHQDQIMFAQMDLTSETSMLFKFAPNQLPVLTLMCRQKREGEGKEGIGEGAMWAKTIMGAELRELERGIEEMLGMAAVENL